MRTTKERYTIPHDRLMRPREVAEFTGFSLTQVYKWFETGQLKCMRFGPHRNLRVWESDLQEFIEQMA